MITLTDISVLMQWCVELGYTFMFSKSGLQGDYNIHIAFMPKLCDNRSLRLSFVQGKGIIYRCADEDSGYEEFSSIPDALQYITQQLTGGKVTI